MQRDAMNESVSIVLMLIAIPSMLLALVSWPCIIFFGVQAARHAKADVNVWSSETLWNPLNVLMYPSLLTGLGLHYRRRCFQATACFVMPILLTMGLAAITGNLG